MKINRLADLTEKRTTRYTNTCKLTLIKTLSIMNTNKQYFMPTTHHFDPSALDSSLQTFQLWSNTTMLTAQLSREDAIKGITDGRYYVISGQAVGYATDLSK